MSRIPYFSFYPSDFMHGVRGLSAQEIGLYTMLLCRIYEEDGPVEYHELRLSAYCGMRISTFSKTVQKLVDLGKITLENGVLSNPRAEVEISKRAHGLKLNSMAGKASAEKRQQKQHMDATDVQRTFNHTDTDTEEVKEEAKASSKKKASRLPEDWRLPKTWGEFAVAEGLSETAVRREADRFRDYWLSVPAAKGVKSKWEAVWRNWIRKAIDDAAAKSITHVSNDKPKPGEVREFAEGWKRFSNSQRWELVNV